MKNIKASLPYSSYIQSSDYVERVYAGVLGKIIGVYLGRPFEGWSNERIECELGEVDNYVHERLNVPLIVTDDDISGTFTFLRALSENGCNADLTPAQIGDWWRNSIVENRTILWWGGLGRSTEHTAYLRLKAGIHAPASGSIATNGVTVAEQIGAQIFIDGWAMVCPGDPERAADWARRAASVSHDGEAIYGAQVVAAMEALAFVEADRHRLLEVAASLIPRDSTIHRLIDDVRGWADAHGDDWQATLRQIQRNYGYDRYGGGCHMVPNHAAILLALLHGNDDFTRTLMIANTSGWDTDCNSGNIGCLMGIKNGLAGIDASPTDWRGPVADRMYLPTADGGRAITDAVRETYAIVDIARAWAGLEPARPKSGARFHFSLPGSLQGFHLIDSSKARLRNCEGALAIEIPDGAPTFSVAVVTPTFTPPSELRDQHYALLASPTLYEGQRVIARVRGSDDLLGPCEVRIRLGRFWDNNQMKPVLSKAETLKPGESLTLIYDVKEGNVRQPIGEVGIHITYSLPVTDTETDLISGTVFLDSLTWDCTPTVTLGPSNEETSDAWQRAWVSSVDTFEAISDRLPLEMCLRHEQGVGMVTQGEWEWSDYTVAATLRTEQCLSAGLLACVRGLRRYVALLLDSDNHVRLIRQHDDTRTVLAEAQAQWHRGENYTMLLTVTENGISAMFGEERLVAVGNDLPTHGAIGLLVETGTLLLSAVHVQPAVDA